MNKFNQSIKFTYEINREKIYFLYLQVSLNNGKITTDLYFKPVNCHQYFNYTSSHPNHTKIFVVYNQILRLSRISSFEVDFNRHRDEMKLWFKNRNYPERIVNQEMSKVKIQVRGKRRNNQHEKGIPFVVTYHPLLHSLGNIIKKHSYILNMDREVKKVFTPKPIISYRSARKLSSYLVRAKLYPIDRTIGSFKCDCNRCQVCHNINETSNFSCSVDKINYKINHRFDCNSKCIIYLLSCNKCNMQYIGQTVDIFRHRWNNYKDNARKF